ncbi:siphovirus Gp157 family protein [Viridibacillus arvi]|uniref:siphovirus Gp157 family protein n=1 Tax=Viridibacillus arvi TaxID=263475 RepID=UPI003D2B3511
MPSLYELTGSFIHIQNLIEDGEDFADTLESLEMAYEDKLEGYGKVIRNLEGDIASYKSEEKRLNDRRKVLENGLARIKAAAFDSLKATGLKTVEAGTFKFSVNKSQASLSVTDQSLIPKLYFIEQEPKLDTALLKEAVKNGEVPGASLTQGEYLKIK